MSRGREKVKKRMAVSQRMWEIVQEERRLVELEKREKNERKWEMWRERRMEREKADKVKVEVENEISGPR